MCVCFYRHLCVFYFHIRHEWSYHNLIILPLSERRYTLFTCVVKTAWSYFQLFSHNTLALQKDRRQTTSCKISGTVQCSCNVPLEISEWLLENEYNNSPLLAYLYKITICCQSFCKKSAQYINLRNIHFIFAAMHTRILNCPVYRSRLRKNIGMGLASVIYTFLLIHSVYALPRPFLKAHIFFIL